VNPERGAAEVGVVVWPIEDASLQESSRALASRKVVIQPKWLEPGVTEKVFHHVAGDWIARFAEHEGRSKTTVDRLHARGFRADQERAGKVGPAAWRRQFPSLSRILGKELRAQKTLILTSIARTLLRHDAPWIGVAAHLLGAADVAPRRRKLPCECESIRAEVDMHGGNPRPCPKHDTKASPKQRASHALRQRLDQLGGDIAVRLTAVIAFLPYLHPTVARLLIPVRWFADGKAWHAVFPRDACGDGFPPAPWQELEPHLAVERMEAVPWQKIAVVRGARPKTSHVHHARPIGLLFRAV
jgi:hypothetical protein